jgi:hypothetical protein
MAPPFEFSLAHWQELQLKENAYDALYRGKTPLDKARTVQRRRP